MSEKVDPNIEFLKLVLDEATSLLIEHLPAVKQISIDVLETILVPRAVARQLLLAIVLDAGMVTIQQVMHLVQYVISNFSPRARLIRRLKKEQKTANSQDEWMDLAERIDNIQGNDVWRSDPSCPLYEQDRISARIDEFVHLMRRGDLFELMFEMRGGIGRNKFGLLHEGLFSKALAGTKVLVETYHNVICAALDYVCDAPVPAGEIPIPWDARLAFFNETRHAYGRTALLLSGGAALGFYHSGVVKTLVENNLMPRVLGGSSAGSIVCAMVATRTDEECVNDFFNIRGSNAPGHFGRLKLDFFRPVRRRQEEQQQQMTAAHRSEIGEVLHNTAGAFKDVKRTWQIFVPIGLRRFTSMLYDVITGNTRPKDIFMNDTDHFRECVRICVGDFTFQEAFDRTGRILNITVTPNNSSDPPRLLNYLTAPHVLVWSAAVASSSLPGVFEANRLLVRDADGTERYESATGVVFSDGSMEQDLPMQQLSEMFNVNHFIISQANPHAVMFASYNQDKSIWTNPVTGLVNAMLRFLKDQVRSWLTHVVELVGARSIAPQFHTQRGVNSQFFTQEYEGRECDISLIPWISHRSLPSALLHLLYNPSDEDFREWMNAAERETWKHIPAIKSHIAEEITLDLCVQRLRKRVREDSRQKARQESAGQTMGDRVPSFFNSPSLVNLSGLGVSDRSNIEGLRHPSDHEPLVARAAPPAMQPNDINMGWGGLGLRGNHSSGSLNKINSTHSGLFVDGEEQEPSSSGQVAGEVTTTSAKMSNGSERDVGSNGYIKTTSMAKFYYRKASSTDDMRRVKSQENVADSAGTSTDDSDRHLKRKSKSQTTLTKMADELLGER